MKEKLEKVIETLKIAQEKYISTPLDMLQSSICATEDRICGTPHCFAGWYFIAKNGAATNGEAFYTGVELLVEDLGFNNEYQLRRWMGKNPYIWGNYRGDKMFVSEIAFSSETRPAGAKSLQDIIDHLTEVQSRLCE